MSTKYKTVRPYKKSEDGIKVYEYEYDHKKYYDKYKEKKGRTVCPTCCSDVSNIYLAKHQATSKKCLKAAEVHKVDTEKTVLLQRLMETVKQLGEQHGINV